MEDASLGRIHSRVDALEDRVIALELTTIRREGPIMDRLTHELNAVVSDVRVIKSTTQSIRKESEKTFTHNQAYVILIIMLVNTLISLYIVTQH